MVRVRPFGAIVLLCAVAACAAPDSGPALEARTTVAGAYVGDPTLLPMAVSLTVRVPAVPPLALAPSQVIELGPGVYALATTVLPESGAFELALPLASELPDAVRVPAPDATVGVLPPGCSVQASSTTVRMTPIEVASPIGTNVVYGFSSVGPRLLALTPSVVDWADPALATFTLLSWVHADGPVTLASSGTCSTTSLDYVVDLALARGWNRVGLRSDVLGGGRIARTVAIDDGAVVFVSSFAP